MSEPYLQQVQGINGLWVQERAELESEINRLRAAIGSMLTHLDGDNFRSQHMAAARSIGEKALRGRYCLQTEQLKTELIRTEWQNEAGHTPGGSD